MTVEAGLLGPIFGQVTLDGSGNGTVRMAPVGCKWEIKRTYVKCSTNVNEAVMTVYQGTVSPTTYIEDTQMGSTGDTSDTTHFIEDGNALFFTWTGGDVGAIATVTISGWQSVPGRGFRAVH